MKNSSRAAVLTIQRQKRKKRKIKKNIRRRQREEVENISDRRDARGGVARNILEINVNANDDIQLHRKHPVREADSQSRVAGETEGRNKDRQRREGGMSG